ncbi:MAG: sulfite exporter TauE/SafE family protein [Bacteroidetes bacterium]|nr:sulfite exporter TauE/SafE family protein [Bacteroidota bacterium]
MEFLLAAITLGILGSFHCVGMCGPIALALPVHHLSTPGKISGLLLYHIGRAFTYSLFGAFFGVLGMGVVIAGYQQALSVVLGIAILIGLFLPASGLSRFFTAPFAGFTYKIKSAFSSLFRKRSHTALFVTGMLNGLLPCGLVYMALAGATATGDITKGALFMAVFGLGTLPAMFSVTFFSGISASFRTKIRKYIPIVAGTMALLLILRGLGLGIPYVSPKMSSKVNTEHNCCHKPASAEGEAACHEQ